ncbi:efflux transporter outer membrane subunit [Sphingomonas glacialis]|uniref:Efflux transporter outer membrane subunit n=1 Tax=Sphingomonas glacialis TaxID=658225 RepID=A0A502FI46_9SPHN|nr:efflux transporter outer membrane subunit [Sphingomonas glacialis]TPG49064.1 efflux transporter outer membrane subunit [Sphingomonas glacialis]
MRANKRRCRAAALVSLVALAGCSLAPDYHQPAVAVAPAYKEAGPWQAAGTAVAPAGAWWEAFGDATFTALETRIEHGNFNLAAAAARYEEASAAVRHSRAALFPQITAGADVERTRVSQGRPLSSGRAVTYNNALIGPSLSYEIDLFGRVRNTLAASRASAQASASDLAAVRLALQAQLGSAYFDMRGLDARIVLLQETVDAYSRAFQLTDTRHSGGIASGIDVSRAQSQLASAKAELDAVRAERARDEHAIAVLIGESPSSFSLPVDNRQIAPPPIPASLPSTLLERRPDILAAERRVASANARIGVARAALYPSISLGAAGGFEAGSGNLLSAANGFWALGPLSLAQTLFDGGARRADVRLSRAQFDEAAANYRQTVLSAFREVEDDLAAGRHLADQERNQAIATTAAERTRDLATTRYRDGASDYLEVVLAQTAALDAERALLTVRTQQLTVATDTVRALGGAFPAS